MNLKRYIANIITGCRIIFSVLMLLFSAFSVWFYVMYLVCGITDMVDGTIARKTKSASSFGSRLDTIADFIFISSAMIKILPTINVPNWIWIWIWIIAIIKCINIVSGFILMNRFVAEHTILNKITGFVLFLLPLTFSYVELKYSAAAVCVIATAAASDELNYIIKRR